MWYGKLLGRQRRQELDMGMYGGVRREEAEKYTGVVEGRKKRVVYWGKVERIWKGNGYEELVEGFVWATDWYGW